LIKCFLKHGLAREHAVEEAIKLLSQLTNYAAMAVGPDPEQNTIKKIDFIPTADNEAVLLIVTNKGHVSHQSIRCQMMYPLKVSKKSSKHLMIC
jgi:heat-inducible transcriptional repressor